MSSLASTREVADYLGVTVQTMANWAHQKKGPRYVKLGNRRKYDWADVREWVEARKVATS